VQRYRDIITVLRKP